MISGSRYQNYESESHELWHVDIARQLMIEVIESHELWHVDIARQLMIEVIAKTN